MTTRHRMEVRRMFKYGDTDIEIKIGDRVRNKIEDIVGTVTFVGKEHIFIKYDKMAHVYYDKNTVSCLEEVT